MKTKLYIGIMGVLTLICSCNKDFLDKQPDEGLTIDQVFKGRTEAEGYLASTYASVPNELNSDGANAYMTAGDDVNFTYQPIKGNEINAGNWSPAQNNNIAYSSWQGMYRGIRSASIFINRIDEVTDLSDALKAQYKAEARVLRAYYYFILIRQYGPVPLLKDVVAPDGDIASTQTPRNTYDECVDYIVTELNTAITVLPQTFTDVSQIGRCDQRVALAIKSNVLLYAASPLFNGNTDYANFKNKAGINLISQTYNVNKWKAAADAAKTLIDMMPAGLHKVNTGGVYDPLTSYRESVTKVYNQEVIWARSGNIQVWAKNCAPFALTGYNSYGATQSIVDAYQMANGEIPITGYNPDKTPIINSASGYSETGFTSAAGKYWRSGVYNMYVNREPRFYANILFNGAEWIFVPSGGSPTVVQYHLSGADSKTKGSYTTLTGYVFIKAVPKDADVARNIYPQSSSVIFRLSEIYLNYAEALNEYSPENPDVLKYVNLIRERAGIPNLPAGLSQAQMRERIRLERRLELAFELRFRPFDTRRWKIAETTDNGPTYGMNMAVGSSLQDPNFYKRTVFETRVFRKEHYLWPIAADELARNPELIQNPFW